jgi:hypothetical protein
VADIIQVLPDETIDSLVTQVTARAASAPSEPVLLWVPRGVRVLHQMEDFQALNRVMRGQGVQIKILSPDARVVGLGKVFGVDAETAAQPPGPAAAEPARPSAPGAAPAGPPNTTPAPPPSTGAQRPGTAPLPPAAPLATTPPRRPTTSPLPVPASQEAPATPPEPVTAPGISETDWLLGEGGNLDALLNDAEDTGRSATPPPDVLLPGLAPFAGPPLTVSAGPPSTIPAPDDSASSETDWLTEGLDLEALAAESLNPDVLPAPPAADSAFAPPATPAANEAPAAPFAGAPVPPPYLPSAGPPAIDPFTASFEQVPPFYMDPEPPAPAPTAASPAAPAAPSAPLVASQVAPPPVESFSLSDLLQAGEEEGGGPPMSFAEWLALQGSGTGAGAPAPPSVDLANLPAWMHPAPPDSHEAPVAPAPPAPPAAGRKGVLRCPHCGEELDKEEMLRMLAEVWGLDS